MKVCYTAHSLCHSSILAHVCLMQLPVTWEVDLTTLLSASS